MCLVARVRLCDPMDLIAHQAPLSVGTPQARILGGGLPCPPPGNLPNPGVKPGFPALQADSLLSEPMEKPNFSHQL